MLARSYPMKLETSKVQVSIPSITIIPRTNDLSFYNVSLLRPPSGILRMGISVDPKEFLGSTEGDVFIAIGAIIDSPHPLHPGGISRNGNQLFSRAAGLVIRNGSVMTEVWNGTPTPTQRKLRNVNVEQYQALDFEFLIDINQNTVQVTWKDYLNIGVSNRQTITMPIENKMASKIEVVFGCVGETFIGSPGEETPTLTRPGCIFSNIVVEDK